MIKLFISALLLLTSTTTNAQDFHFLLLGTTWNETQNSAITNPGESINSGDIISMKFDFSSVFPLPSVMQLTEIYSTSATLTNGSITMLDVSNRTVDSTITVHIQVTGNPVSYSPQCFNCGTLGNNVIVLPSPIVFNNIDLPVELVSFKGKQVDGQAAVKLNWTTATELNNQGFEVERSTNGINFTPIGWVDGNGTTLISKNYFFIDNNLNGAIGYPYYYRLKQVDFNGEYQHSSIVSPEINPIRGANFRWFFNENGLFLNAQGWDKEKIHIQITSLNGQVLQELNNIQPFSGNKRIPTGTNLPTGLLVAVMRYNNSVISMRFINSM